MPADSKFYVFRRPGGNLGVLVERDRPGAERRLESRVPGALIGGELDGLDQVALALGMLPQDVDPERYHEAHIVEAACSLCGETFGPNPFEDEGPWLEHLGDADGNECGGVGRVLGAYYLPHVAVNDEARRILGRSRSGQ